MEQFDNCFSPTSSASSLSLSVFPIFTCDRFPAGIEKCEKLLGFYKEYFFESIDDNSISFHPFHPFSLIRKM